ncbi:hypothetical protein KAW18_03895 [candidate division WOR-3 bacterium]|nr:hypothetical protein [candidate division WOR-3 bacterium]
MMAKIVLHFDETLNLLSIFSTQPTCNNIQFRRKGGDNKVIIKHPREVRLAMELLFGKPIKRVTKGEYSGTVGSFFEFELPVSECGEFLLIKKPTI